MNNMPGTPVIRWIPCLLWAGLIFYLSSRPDVKLPGSEFVLKDKVAHFFAFGILYALLLYAGTATREVERNCGIGLLAVIAYGFLDEIHQRYVPGRLSSGYDFLADAAGAIAVYSTMVSMRQRKTERSEVQKAQGNS